MSRYALDLGTIEGINTGSGYVLRETGIISPVQLEKKTELEEKFHFSSERSLGKTSSKEWLQNSIESERQSRTCFGQINYLPISALSHSQESNSEENRKDMPWRGPVSQLTGIWWTPRKNPVTQPEWHLDRGSNELMKGTGLELALVLVRQYWGTIWAAQ